MTTSSRSTPAALHPPPGPGAQQFDVASSLQFQHQLTPDEPATQDEEQLEALSTQLEHRGEWWVCEPARRVAVHDQDDSQRAEQVQAGIADVTRST